MLPRLLAPASHVRRNPPVFLLLATSTYCARFPAPRPAPPRSPTRASRSHRRHWESHSYVRGRALSPSLPTLLSSLRAGGKRTSGWRIALQGGCRWAWSSPLLLDRCNRTSKPNPSQFLS